jgi:hypothetical protein
MYEALPPELRDFVVRRAAAMGLPSPDDYVVLTLRLQNQHHRLQGVEEGYRKVFAPARPLAER